MLDETEYGVVRLDGTMPQAKRASALERFKTDTDVSIFLISLRSGGVGLNLTAASHVMLMDPWWNFTGSRDGDGGGMCSDAYPS